MRIITGRIIGMLLTGLALALAVLILIEVIPPLGPEPIATAVNGSEADPNASIMPPIFRTIEEEDARLVISGTSEPESELTLFNDRRPLIQTRSNADGEWNIELPVDEQAIMALDISLSVDGNGRTWGDETVLRVPAPSISGGIIPRSAALIMVTAPGGPTRIVQNPFNGDLTNGALTMGPIDYDDSGGVIFSGQSKIPGRVRIYGDGAVIGETQITNAGRWFFIAADTLPEGPFEIGAELTTSNSALSRIDVVLTRKKGGNGSVTSSAEYGKDVWQIRRTLVGGGAQYVAVFNPDGVQDEPE